MPKTTSSPLARWPVLLGALFTALLITALACAVLVQSGFRGWIELFNGATWPENFPDPAAGAAWQCWFYLVLAFRTLMNLGVVLTGAWALILLLNGGLEGLVMSRMETILHRRDAALAMYLTKVLREQQVALPNDIAETLLRAADDFKSTPAGRRYAEQSAELTDTRVHEH
jgi:hypothetical protein